MQMLTRWEPFREMEDFQNRLSTFFGRPLRRGNGREEITLSEWTPLADTGPLALVCFSGR
jgi:hypothetical protein